MSYKNLTESQQRQFARLLVARRNTYVGWLHTEILEDRKDILIVGDRPGPKAPDDEDYHNTPFYSKTYSGGWLTAQMVLHGITEDRLLWINSATKRGVPTDQSVLTAQRWSTVIALGNNAAKWLTKNDCADFIKCDHPQFHRRFKSAEPYPLIELLSKLQVQRTISS